MSSLDEVEISKTILCTYHERFLDRIASDVIIVGAGPSGLVAAYFLAKSGLKVTVLEKRLAPGGGIWGGGMAMNVAVVQDEAVPLLDEMGIRSQPRRANLHAVDAVELAAGLCWKALQAGVIVFNLTTCEDVCIRNQRLTGVVVNRTNIAGALPVDPIVFSAKAVLDATGHEAVLVQCLRRRGLLPTSVSAQEGPMHATAGEAFVVDRAGEVFPGLWLSGMSVAATLGGPRMGPIFGGMLLSGKRVAEAIAAAVSDEQDRQTTA
ncbi:MAG: thiazole biosynthesis protein [Planctomycetaceae bacterium]|nr:thiazole biosynthesis protein [Planctomycetaceae bacterium]